MGKWLVLSWLMSMQVFWILCFTSNVTMTFPAPTAYSIHGHIDRINSLVGNSLAIMWFLPMVPARFSLLSTLLRSSSAQLTIQSNWMTMGHTETLWWTEGIGTQWGSESIELRGKSLVAVSRIRLRLPTHKVEIHMGMYAAHLALKSIGHSSSSVKTPCTYLPGVFWEACLRRPKGIASQLSS